MKNTSKPLDLAQFEDTPATISPKWLDLLAECKRQREEIKVLREQLADCTTFIRQACEQKILDRAECKPLLKQWEAPLSERAALKVSP